MPHPALSKEEGSQILISKAEVKVLSFGEDLGEDSINSVLTLLK